MTSAERERLDVLEAWLRATKQYLESIRAELEELTAAPETPATTAR